MYIGGVVAIFWFMVLKQNCKQFDTKKRKFHIKQNGRLLLCIMNIRN